MEELELIRQANQGSLDAYNQIVLAYQERIFNQAYRILGDTQAAEDAAQEAFLAAYIKLKTYRGGSFKAWLLRITSNLCFDYLRREKVRPTVALEPVDEYGEEIESAAWLVDPGSSPQEAVERSDFWEDLQACLDRLNPEYRLALVLVDIQEMDYIEAAEAMGVSIGTLKSRLVRGRLKMRELLKRRGSSRVYAGPDRSEFAGRRSSPSKGSASSFPNRTPDRTPDRTPIVLAEPCG
jgi:RNA polymerase sigma-70 factor, ECF subfamily